MSEHATAATDSAPSKLLTVAEACQRLSIGRTRLYELLGSGELTSIKLPGSGQLGGRRIEESAIADFLDRHRQPAVTSSP